MTRRSLASWTVAFILLATAASAQTQFVSGPLTWSPSLQLQEFGYDTSIFDQAPAVGDFVATLRPQVDLAISTRLLKVSGTGTAALRYYERTADQRSLNRTASGRVELPLRAFVPFVAGAYSRVRDRTPEVLTPNLHTDDDASVGASLFFTSRAAIQVAGRRSRVEYDPGQVARDRDLAAAMNRQTHAANLAVRMALTPLTSLSIDAAVQQDAFTFDSTRDQEDRRLGVALEFAPDAVIRGRAAFGYHTLTTSGDTVVPFKGPTFDVDLSYLLLGVTRIDGRYRRDTTVSVETPFYEQITYGIDVVQDFLGPTDLIGRYSTLTADYPGLPERNMESRVDRTRSYATGLAIRMTDSTQMTINYELTLRRSTTPALNVDRHRVFTTVSMGF